MIITNHRLGCRQDHMISYMSREDSMFQGDRMIRSCLWKHTSLEKGICVTIDAVSPQIFTARGARKHYHHHILWTWKMNVQLSRYFWPDHFTASTNLIPNPNNQLTTWHCSELFFLASCWYQQLQHQGLKCSERVTRRAADRISFRDGSEMDLERSLQRLSQGIAWASAMQETPATADDVSSSSTFGAERGNTKANKPLLRLEAYFSVSEWQLFLSPAERSVLMRFWSRYFWVDPYEGLMHV